MKTFTVEEAQSQFGRLVAEAALGGVIIVTDGNREVILASRAAFPILDLEEDSPELEDELLKAVRGGHAPLADNELRKIADRAVAEHRTQAGA